MTIQLEFMKLIPKSLTMLWEEKVCKAIKIFASWIYDLAVCVNIHRENKNTRRI